MLPHERISAKLAKFRPSLTLMLKRLAGERLEKGLPVFDFGLGETKGHLDDEIREAGIAAFREEETMYADPAGMPELRRAVLKWLNVELHYGIDNVVISAGAKQSLFNIFLAICNPADCVLFDSAPWVSYQPLAVAAYAFPVQVLPISRADSFLKVGPEDLRRNLKMRPHAKMFVLNTPCNPTGQMYDAAEVDALLTVCAQHGVYMVLDRLYWRIVFDGKTFPEPRIDEQTRPWLIQVDGMSKNFRRTGGLRIGWTVAPDDVSVAMANLQSHYTSGPATPTQRTALAAISRPYRGGMVKELQEKRDLLHREATEMPNVAIWPTPASFYSFWDVRACFGKRTPEGKVLTDSTDVAEYLCVAAGVITASGVGFMQDGYLRLSFATPEDHIIEGMRAARKALGALA
ncbi:MAG: aminotransferase class I/II-fold pyridoxal phosphate-dependent enzyme [Planctomycetota bacterium]|nr:aminotransferase class I/II-fold pyridoxal phosphate-dependent enzyme [Planctomycetota bacterium]